MGVVCMKITSKKKTASVKIYSTPTCPYCHMAKDYLKAKNVKFEDIDVSSNENAAREMVAKAGSVVGIHLRPHDLRRHAATYASRSGVPIEIVSKVILRHSNLSTTERYLGKFSDVEAMKWIDNLYA